MKTERVLLERGYVDVRARDVTTEPPGGNEQRRLLNFGYAVSGERESTYGSFEGTAEDAIAILRRFTVRAANLFIVLDATLLMAIFRHGDLAVAVEFFDGALERHTTAVGLPEIAEVAVRDVFAGVDPMPGLEESAEYCVASPWKPDREDRARRSPLWPKRDEDDPGP